LHHNISSTHIVHHINSRIPHYRAVAATKDLKKLLGSLYNYDDRDVFTSILDAQKNCEYIDNVNGIQY